MENKQIKDKVNVKECKYYCNGKCERYEEFVEADYANYSMKCICEEENCLGTYDVCDYQQLTRKEQECEKLKEDEKSLLNVIDHLQKTKNEWEEKYNDLGQDFDQLKAENDTLFKAIEEVNKINKKLKADNEQLKEELSVIQHNCNREGCKYYDDDTFKVFYECKAQKALQLSANSVTTKYCDLLKAIIEIKAICNNNDELQGDFNAVDCDKYKLGKHNLANKILQKISEVNNGNK